MISIFKMEKFILSFNEDDRAIMEIALTEFVDRAKAENKRFRKRGQYQSIESNRKLKKGAEKAIKKLNQCQDTRMVADTAEDEPMFILRGADPIASFLVGAWRMMHGGDMKNAHLFLDNAPSVDPVLPKSHPDSKAAYTTSVLMEDFYQCLDRID